MRRARTLHIFITDVFYSPNEWQLHCATAKSPQLSKGRCTRRHQQGTSVRATHFRIAPGARIHRTATSSAAL